MKNFSQNIKSDVNISSSNTGTIHGYGADVKVTQLWIRRSFHENSSGFEALGFHECGSGSGALFFHGSGSSSGFYSFSHIKILIVLVRLKLNGKWIKWSTQNYENIPNLFELFNLVVFYKQRSYHEEINRKNNNHMFRRFRELLLAET